VSDQLDTTDTPTNEQPAEAAEVEVVATPTDEAEGVADDPAPSDAADEGSDDLDDLLGIAGAGPDAEATDADADELVAPASEDDATAEEEAPAKPARPRRPGSVAEARDQRDLRRMHGDWFVVHTYAGYEQRVKDNLSNRIDTYEVGDRIHEIVIPTEEVTEYKKGKKVISDKKFLPGYVLVRMDMDDDTWGIVRHTPAVTGFVGANGIKPVPLSIREVGSTLKIPVKFVEETEVEGGGGDVVPEKQQVDIDMEVGETVRVTTGPFADFTGTIAEINIDQAKLRVLVSVFGRETPIEIPFDNVTSI
jgi:transcriptional antiterminator NusG